MELMMDAQKIYCLNSFSNIFHIYWSPLSHTKIISIIVYDVVEASVKRKIGDLIYLVFDNIFVGGWRESDDLYLTMRWKQLKNYFESFFFIFLASLAWMNE